MVWIWAVVFLATLLTEVITIELASIWFTFGSLVAFILALCGVGTTIQVVVFVLISIVLFFSLRPICMKLLNNSKETTNVDSMVGTVHTLISEIKEEKPGEIKINGVSWRAVSKNNEEFNQGDKVKIVEVQGNKFVVEKGE